MPHRAVQTLLELARAHLALTDVAGAKRMLREARILLSQHTVKSQATSVYRKLGVSSRSQAIQRIQQTGLPGT